jgi:hypothetical protein
MSYDILVFDSAHAPSGREAFLRWWDAQAEWSEPHRYNDPAVTTPSLRAWFMEMIEQFPALSGPYAASRDQRTADYCIGHHLIYVAISFDKQATHERAYELAGKHRLGFFEASSPDGEIWLPGTGNQLVLASKRERRLQSPKPVTDPRIAALIGSHSPGDVVVQTVAHAEDPRRIVSVVYSRSWLEALGPPAPFGSQGGLAQLERALAEAGIVYAVVEQHEQRAFAKELMDALAAKKDALSEK